MKKRLLIICSIIGVLLAGFQFPIYAEETSPDFSSSTSIITSSSLDQYFYDNYELLPYIRSDGNQYIDTGYNSSNLLKITCKITNLNGWDDSYNFVFGSSDNLDFGYKLSTDNLRLKFNQHEQFYSYDVYPYSFLNIVFDKNNCFVNNALIHSFDEESFSGSNIYIFTNNTTALQFYSSLDLYGFSIYDYAANDGEGALVRDYYPARAKSSSVIGLYDAVNKTFVTTSGSVPFESVSGDPVNLSLGSHITEFLYGSLSWIGAIFEGINEMPIIWVFIAIALAGVMFRWARRIVHF